MENTDIIGRGNTAEILPWGDGRVLKRFRNGIDPALIQRERHATRIAGKGGLPVPELFGEARSDGRTGLVYERMDGPTMTRSLSQNPGYFRRLARELAELHWQVHRQEGTMLPSFKESLARSIRRAPALPVSATRSILKELDALPEGDRLPTGISIQTTCCSHRKGP